MSFNVNDFISGLRLNDIMGQPQQTFGGSYQNPMQPPIETPRFQNTYQPETRMQDAFADMILNQMPQPQKTGFWRGLGSALYGMSMDDPFAAATNAANAPYFNQLNAWGQQGKFLGAAADNERQANIANRQAMNQDMMYQYRYDDLARKSEYDQMRGRVARQNADTAEGRLRNAEARTEVYRAISRGGEIKQDEAGNTFVVYKDGSTKPVDLNQFSPKELEELRIGGRLKVAGANNAAAMDRTKQQGKNAIDRTKVAGEETRKTNEAKPITSAFNRPTTPSAQATQWKNNAQKIKAERPEWAPFIEIKGNSVTIIPPAQGFFGGQKFGTPDKKTYDEIRKAIYGDGVASEQSTNAETIAKETKVGQDPNLRERAIAELRKRNKAVTEESIAQAIKILGGK